MRNVRLSFLLMLFLILSFSYQGCADCPPFVEGNTRLEVGVNRVGKGIGSFVTFQWNDLNFNEKLLKHITVRQIKNQGINGYFNPKIQVCDYEEGNCYELYSGTSCHHIYGTQKTGGGVSAAVFIDWEGDKISVDEKGAESLEWEWADNVTDEEKRKFANSPKICACSQKGACISGGFAWGANVLSGENIFENRAMENVCDTCLWSEGKQKIKCAPVPLAPSPPPFCEQLAMSPPQVRIVPITNKDNNYFNPKVGVMISGLGERKELDVQRSSHKIEDGKGTTYYFETYRKKDQLCAEYHGTEREESKRKLQYSARCFPAPPAPELEEVSIPKPDEYKGKNTLKVKMKMSENACTRDVNAHGTHNNGVCTFYVNAYSSTRIGHLSLTVVKPAIVAKTTTTQSNSNRSDVDNMIEGILKNNSQFKALRKYGYVPDITTKCKKKKCKLDNLGHLKIEVKYNNNSRSKMLCLSGWQPEPEDFVLEREGKVIPLKSMGAGYVRYDAVYSKESNQFYYLPSKERKTVNLLDKSQDQLDEIIFNEKGYVFFPDENKQEKGKCSYCVDNNKDIGENFGNNEVKVVYKLVDVKHEEVGCKQGDDGCIELNREWRRSTQYVDKDNKPFYFKTSKKQNDGVEQLEHPITANRTEVFYADKLCMFDLEGLKAELKKIIKKKLIRKKEEIEKKGKGSYGLGTSYTDNLSIYDSVEIEAWGSGEAGRIQSMRSRSGMPGDYIKAKLKIDPNYPIIKVTVKEGGEGPSVFDMMLNSTISIIDTVMGNTSNYDSQLSKHGESTVIEMCDLNKVNCRPLITVAGGGKYDTDQDQNRHQNTIIHEGGLMLEEEIIKGDNLSVTKHNRIVYIDDSAVKYKDVAECNQDYISEAKGAGGCINKDNGSYSKGSPGYVKIKPMFAEFNEEKIKKIYDAVERMVQNLDDITGVDDLLINKIDKNFPKTMQEAFKKELLAGE